MEKLLQRLNETAVNLSKSAGELHDIASSIGPTFEGLPTSNWITYADTISRVARLADLVVEMSSAEPAKFVITPISQLSGINDQLSSAQVSVNDALSALRSLPDRGQITKIEGNGVITTADGQQQQTRPLFDQIATQVDIALQTRAAIAISISQRSIGTFSSAARRLDEKAAASQRMIEEVTTVLSDSRKTLDQVKTTASSTKEQEGEGRRILEEVEKQRRTAAENVAAIDAAMAQARELQSQTSTLEARIREYQPTFDTFQKELSKREKEVSEGRLALGALLKELKENSEAVEGLIGKAEEMLGGATIAGLSNAYSEQVSSIDKKLSVTQIMFYVSIVFLLVSSAASLGLIPFLPHLPALPSFSDKTPTGSIAVQALSALGSRALVLLPALLLVAFIAKRHATLFRLRHEYAHKYTTAASVHGFKQQAPAYQDQITAAVFEELLKNPSDVVEEPARAGKNSFIERLIQPYVDRAISGMKLIPDTKKE